MGDIQKGLGGHTIGAARLARSTGMPAIELSKVLGMGLESVQTRRAQAGASRVVFIISY
jgi:hypothetical protein